MAIETRILGKRGKDNAVLVTVNTGRQISRLLLDCGENTASELSFAESSSIDHVLFSHFHMDHVAGFDGFFRRHYDRSDRVNEIWGPPGTMELMGHRFRGFVWNLVGDRKASWLCHDIGTDAVSSARFELAEAFAQTHPMESKATPEFLCEGPGYRVESLRLNHGIPSIGYVVREPERFNIDPHALASMGLKPGAWLKTLATDTECDIDGVMRDAAPLREALVVRSSGDSVAFLTDFMAEGEELHRIAERIKGVGTLVCECQYCAEDEELARRNFHMTTSWVGQLAALAEPKRLLLTHFSERYSPEQWLQMEDEVKAACGRVMVG